MRDLLVDSTGVLGSDHGMETRRLRTLEVAGSRGIFVGSLLGLWMIVLQMRSQRKAQTVIQLLSVQRAVHPVNNEMTVTL